MEASVSKTQNLVHSCCRKGIKQAPTHPFTKAVPFAGSLQLQSDSLVPREGTGMF